MYNVKLYNKISKVGLDDLDAAKYTCSEDFTDYDAVLVRSAKLHEVEFPKDLKCIARAGAGVNNIPIDRCSQEGIVVFNTPGANANAVKELVICALLLASRRPGDRGQEARHHRSGRDRRQGRKRGCRSGHGGLGLRPVPVC